MKKALLTVSFGTSVPEAEKAILHVEEALKAACPGREAFRAYTSTIICRKLQREGRPVSEFSEALGQLAAADFRDVLIVPTHLTPGNEYEKLCRIAKEFEGRFERLRIASPLISSPEDLLALARAVLAHFPPQNDRALLLMGHGSPHISNMIYPALQTAFRLLHAQNVFVGTVEGWPEIEDCLEELQESGLKTVELAPLMLVAGDHAQNDMAGEEPESWKNQLKESGFTVRCRLEGLGEWEEICNLYVQHLQKADQMET